MHFIKTPLEGAYLIDLDKKGDDRGFFARFFCAKEFKEYGLEENFVQVNNSLSVHKGTMRGMHYQLSPLAESKLVRCLTGSLYDVILDLRKESPTFGQWFGSELNPENRRMMYVPKGFGHGFVSLKDHTEILYLSSQYYSSELERGIRWNDPKFAIRWPIPPTIISEKDAGHPDFNAEHHLGA